MNLKDRTPLGWLQLKKDRSRTFLALAGIAFADLLMLVQIGLQAALFDTNTRLGRSLDADLILRSTQYRDLVLPNTFARHRLYTLLDVPGVEKVTPVYISRFNWKHPQTGKKTDLTLLAHPPSQSVLTIPQITSQLEKLQIPDTFLFDRRARGNYKEMLKTIDNGGVATTEVGKTTIKIVGLFSLGASFATDGTIVTSDTTFIRLFPERSVRQVNLGLIKLKPGADPDQIVAQLKLPADVEVLTYAQFTKGEKDYIAGRTPIGLVFNFGTAMAFAVGTVIVLQILTTDVNEHLAEYATFKAMGYRDRYLWFIILEQSLLLAVVGFIPGVGLSVMQYAIIRHAVALPIRMTLARLLLVLFATIGMCVFSGTLAARKLQQADPADIF